MALELNLTKNTNDAIQGTLGKYYARVEYKGTMGLRELASHMHHHNTAFSKGIILGVLNDMVDCIKELALTNNLLVNLDEFDAIPHSQHKSLRPGQGGVGPNPESPRLRVQDHSNVAFYKVVPKKTSYRPQQAA